MEDAKLEFLPFHAINEFMRPDFRLNVVRTALSNASTLPESIQDPIIRLTKKLVKVPGFRSSDKAPATIRLLPSIPVFEKHPEFVAAILSAWSTSKPALRAQVYDVLKERGWYIFPTEFKTLADFPLPKKESDWGILPPEADRSRLPGFVVYWPKKENFELIYDTFLKLFPDSDASIDEVSLMAVWLSMRLPYHYTDDETTHEETRIIENDL